MEQQVKELYEQGESTWSIAKLLGISQMQVRRLLKKAGVATRPISANRGPVEKGGTHHWGPKITAGLRGHVGANLGKRGPDAPNWKGGIQTDPNGRVRVWDPDRKRYIPRAVTVWQDANGPVGKGFVVHHRNGDPADDRLENLIRLSNSEHLRVHRRHDRDYIQTLQGIIESLGGTYPPYHDET